MHRSRLLNAWVFTRHAHADAILRDHRRFGNDPRKGTLWPRQQALLRPGPFLNDLGGLYQATCALRKGQNAHLFGTPFETVAFVLHTSL